jgi:hypothetical protein
MTGLLHYLHHLWADPISASEQFEAFVLVVLPMLFGAMLAMGLWQWFWEKYNGER